MLSLLRQAQLIEYFTLLSQKLARLVLQGTGSACARASVQDRVRRVQLAAILLNRASRLVVKPLVKLRLCRALLLPDQIQILLFGHLRHITS